MKRPKIKTNARAKRKFYPFEHQGESTGLKELIYKVLEGRRSEDGLKSVIPPWLFCTTHKRTKRDGG